MISEIKSGNNKYLGAIKITVAINLVDSHKFIKTDKSKTNQNITIKNNSNNLKECIHLKTDGQSVELFREQQFINPTLYYFDYTFDFNISKQSQIINNNQLLDNMYRVFLRNSVLDVFNGYNSSCTIYGQEESNTIGMIYGTNNDQRYN